MTNVPNKETDTRINEPADVPFDYDGVRYPCGGPRTTDGGRIGCGYDLTGFALAIPGDGENYTVECPQCGEVSSWMRTPPE